MNERDIVMTHKQISWAAAGLLFFCFFSFVIGYYVGKNRDVIQVTRESIKDSFADQIAASLYASERDESVLLGNEFEPTFESELSEQDVYLKVDNQSDLSVEKNYTDGKSYYAQLIGFSMERSAQKCAKKWQQQGFNVVIQKRVSSTAQGKRATWYQVVTTDYENKKELEKIVAYLAKQEKLNDIRIIARDTSRV